MNKRVKRLGIDDISQFKELTELFKLAFEDKAEENLPSDDQLSNFLQRSSFLALVYIQEGQVVGGLTGYFLEMYMREGREIYIYDLAVAEEPRRNGIATALVQELKALAKQENVKTIFVEAEHEDEEAVKFYSSLNVEHLVVDHFNIIVR